MNCRHCGEKLQVPFVDLGVAPPSNAYFTEDALKSPEKWFPLRVLVCTNCWLVQTEDYVGAEELFSADYAYFSSYSDTWLAHSKLYVQKMIERFGLNPSSFVIEVASNDGYLLQYVKAHNIPCLGIEPTMSTALAARAKGIDTIEDFFGVRLAKNLASQGKYADLMIANNVLAHVPDINDFVRGFAILLKEGGIATFEFPHLLRLVEEAQFDTIYHEHYSYLSLTAVKRIFEANGLSIFDVEELSTHGGSLRVYSERQDSGLRKKSPAVEILLKIEKEAGIETKEFYSTFQTRAERIKDDLLIFLIDAKRKKKKVCAYGAAAKGNTLLNFAGIKPDLISFVADKNPAKQDKYLPGSHIPIVAPERITYEKPDYIIILPWNLKEEITRDLAFVRQWGGKFVVAVPELRILD